MTLEQSYKPFLFFLLLSVPLLGCGSDSPSEPDPDPAPTVTGVTANTGTVSGGLAVTIAGTGFSSGATVTFGATAATSVTVASSTSITATTPAHAAGPVAVNVRNPDAQSGTLANAFTYIGPPTITNLTPEAGNTGGGTTVSITGTGFVAVPSVMFGGTPATGISFSGSTSITATAPAHGAGTVDLVVTNPDGQSVTLSSAFTYFDPPTINSITPNQGSAAGGTVVSITGSNFLEGATVTFGGAGAVSVTVNSSTSISAVSPGHDPGTVDIVVTNPDGQSATFANGFAFLAGPTVTSVTPNQGSAAGGFTVTITGTSFAAVPSVTFGGAAATGVAFASSTSLVATVPAHAAGVVDIVVTNPDGQSGTLEDGFTYVAPPTVTSVSPNTGSVSGGADVAVTGANFVNGATVTFGGIAANPVAFVSSTSLIATIPAHAAGAVDVTVTNPDTQSGTLANGFTYLAPTQLTKNSWQVDFAYTGGSFRLEVFFTQTGDVLSGSNRDNNAELDVVTAGRVTGSAVVITFTLSNGGSPRGSVTCTGTIAGSPQTISGTFTSPSTEAVGGLNGTCIMS